MTIPTLPVPSFAAAFAPADELGPPQSFLLYGDTGTQKTLALGRLVKAGFFKKVLFIDIDNGAEVLMGDPEVRAAMLDGRITRVRVDPFDPQAMAKIESYILETLGYWRTPTGQLEINPNIPNFGYDLLFIDTVNLVHEVALKHLQATTYNDQGTKLDGLKAYAKISVWMDEMIRLIHNSNRLVGGFVMHAKTYEEKTGATKIKPKMSGSFKDSIATIPSITAYLDYEPNVETKVPELVATVGESDLYESKNRYNFPAKLRPFDIVEMYRTIYTQIGLPLPAEANTTPAPAPVAA